MADSLVSELGTSSTEIICPDCGSHYVRRLPRQGFLQKKVYSFFGYYPWECAICRKTIMLKRRGKRHRRSRASK